MTWAIFGGSVLGAFCFCCVACRCLYMCKASGHWKQQRFGWAKAQAETDKKHGIGIDGSGRIVVQTMRRFTGIFGSQSAMAQSTRA